MYVSDLRVLLLYLGRDHENHTFKGNRAQGKLPDRGIFSLRQQPDTVVQGSGDDL